MLTGTATSVPYAPCLGRPRLGNEGLKRGNSMPNIACREKAIDAETIVGWKVVSVRCEG